MLQCAGGNDRGDVRGAMQLEHPRAFVERCPAGHYVVDQQNALPRHVGRALEGTTDILAALLERQVGLSRGWPVTEETVVIDGEIQLVSDHPGNFHRLVETSFTQAFGMQWQGHDQLLSGFDLRRQPMTQPVRHSQLMAVFQRVNDPVGWKVVVKRGQRLIEVRRIRQAGTAAFAMRGLLGTLRAASAWWYRQVGGARWAEQSVGAVAAAQQATPRKGVVEPAAGELFQPMHKALG